MLQLAILPLPRPPVCVLQGCPQAKAHADFSSYSYQGLLFQDLIHSAVNGVVNVIILAIYIEMCTSKG